MKTLYKASALTSALLLASTTAFAQDSSVTLTSADLNFEATGELVSFDEDSYVIGTAIGNLTVDRALVNCAGEACPVVVAEVEDTTEVTLVSADGTRFSGDLVEFDGTNYLLATQMGVLTIRKEFVTCEGGGCPSETAAPKEDRSVTLASGTGMFFEGDLLEFDGTNYLLETQMGVLTIRSEFVTCEGATCPDTGPVIAEFSIASPAGVGELFVSEAISRFTDEKSLNITRSISVDGTQVNYLVGDSEGSLVADITVVPSNDVASIKALFDGTAAFALTREAFTPQDIASVTNMAVSDVSALLNEKTIALDALTAHIHPANRVRSISITEIGDILSGRVQNWADIGGDSAPISLHTLAAETNLARIIKRDILAPRGLQIASSATMHDTLDALNEAVANDPQAFTVSYRSEASGTNIPSTRNSCNIFSSANSFSLQTEEYPLTMRWHLYTLKGQEIPDLAGSLADYLSSDQGQASAELAGLVGLDIDIQPMHEQGERLLSAMLAGTISNAGIKVYQDYLAEVSTSDRLSTTLHFVTGSSQLDQRAISDIGRISDMVADGLLDGNDIILIGFSDSVGNFSGNVNLSRSRADQAKALFLQENIGRLAADDITTLGFGPVAPVGCNTDIDGRQLNRRVEVWIRGTNLGKMR